MSSLVIELKKLVIKNDVATLKKYPELLQYAGVGELTALELAIILDRREIVDLILRHHSELVNWPNWAEKEMIAMLAKFGIEIPERAPLHVAAQFCRPEIAELLLRHGADPNIRDRSGSTPLHIAASSGCASVAELLLSHKADPHVSNDEGRRPYEMVKDPHTAYVFLKRGISNYRLQYLVAQYICYHDPVPEYVEVLPSDALYFCASRKFLEYMLQRGRIDVAAVIAAHMDDIDVLEDILSKKPELAPLVLKHTATPEAFEIVRKYYTPTAEELQSLFEFTIKYGHKKLVTHLLNYGVEVTCEHLKTAHPEAVDVILETRHLRCNNLIRFHIYNTEMLEVLLKYHVPSGEDLCYALKLGRTESAQIIARHVVYVSHHCLCEYFDEEVIKILVERGVLDPNAKCGDMPLLHLAAKYCYRELTEALLRNGADITATDDRGRFAPEVACREVADLFARL